MYYQEKLGFKPEEILVYLRKSRSDDPNLTVEEVLEKHEKILDDWCLNNIGELIPEENKFREVVSGETIDDRPEIQKILKLIESPRYKAVLVVEIQRLSRGDLEDAGRLIKLLRYTNTTVLTQFKNFDLRDEYDRDFFERELKRGNEYLEYQKKILKRGRMLSVQQGNYLASNALYGYNKTYVMDGKRKCPTLEINEEEANVVRMIFDLYVNKNMGYTNIAKELERLGIKPPKAKYWSAYSIDTILSNIHYIGKIRWNLHKVVSVIEDGEVVKKRPKAKFGEYMICEGKHEAIISEELFNKAAERMGKNPRIKSERKLVNAFAGLLFCECGRAMIYRTNRDSNGDFKQVPRLLCGNQTRCGNASCVYPDMEERIIEVLEHYIEDFEIKVKNNDNDSIKLHENLVKNLEKKLEDLEKKEISQWEKYSEEGMPKHIFEKLNEKVLREKEEVNHALCEAKNSMPEFIDYEERILRFKNALEALKDPNVDAMKKNKLLKDCIERIEYKRQKIIRLDKQTIDEMKDKNNKVDVSHAGWTDTPIELNIKLRL